MFTPRTEFGDLRGSHHHSWLSFFPSQLKKSWRWHPNPTCWGLPAVPGSRGGQIPPAGSTAPQNIPSSNSLLFQADFFA